MQRRVISLVTLLCLIHACAWGAFNPLGDRDIVGWWTFDEGSGTIAFDSSPNANDGTVEGGATWVPGVFTTALSFNGTDAYVGTGQSFLNNVEDFTMAGWVMARNATGSRIGVFGQNDLVEMGFNGGPVEVWTAASGTTNAPWGFSDTEWHHIAVVDEDTSMLIYLDGQLAVTGAGAASHATSSYAFNIGGGGIWDATGNWFNGQLDDVTLFARALTEAEVQAVMLGVASPELASNPSPADGATDIPRDVILSWTAGDFAAAHDVYFGTAFNDVNNASRTNPMGVLLSQGRTDASFDPPGILDFSQTYYWRIDEVNAAPDNTIFKGDVWSFTTEPFVYPALGVVATSNGISEEDAGPENTVNGSGLDADGQHSIASADMWLAGAPADEPLWIQFDLGHVHKLHEMRVWNYNVMFEILLGFGLKNVTVDYSENGVDWTSLGDQELSQATAQAAYVYNSVIDFGGAAIRYVRLTVNSGFGMMGQFGLSEVRFMYIPAQAREPQPADGATGVDPDATLSWRAGREAVSHEVHLGSDPNALTLASTVNSASFAPANLQFGNTYYWQIVEVNEADAITAWPGDVWSFQVRQYASVDDFESYTDDVEAATTIFDTWIDGWINDNGSTVGYFNAPFAEQTIVHGGGQSMPLAYDNTANPFYSEAERIFDTPQNWQVHGADTVVLYIRGNAPAFAEAGDGSIIMNAIGADIWDVSDQFRYAYKSLNGNGSITVCVDSIVRSNEWAKAGVMIRETLDPSSTHAFVAVTPEPTHGISFQRRPIAGQASTNTDVADIEMPHWVRLTRTGNIFTAQQSVDGVTWVDITPAAPVDIPMTANVFIGLALTSHDAAISTAAEFSNASTTGNVTGAWQTAEIGVAQPTGNSSESMYVRIEDSSGNTATVVNADTAITQRPTWQEWKIPYTELTGVNVSRIQSMAIGIGSRISPSAGGTGTIYVDDIGFGNGTVE